MAQDDDITGLLVALKGGDPAARDQLFRLIYRDLHARAHRQLARSRPGDTLSTTALVHETYLKLVGSTHQAYLDRGHFFAVAARAMRQILVDYARSRLADKRGGGARNSTLEPEQLAGPQRSEDLIALDEALIELSQLDERLAETVELRYFAGLSVEEVAEARGVSPRTVKRDWRKARAFLYRAIQGDVVTDLDGPDSD
ncbi:MAG TPA: sigma-70 family RNA polymerase sigma factor [Gemmatimonadales bacterium]|jgi:RNA polymerase sigma factor (TIGR02999 family)|nr:sigma-70 family RNA polymerase sigma factor [Gemmatimonadales bacterium]